MRGIRDRRLKLWGGLLEEAGFACERQRLGAVYDGSWRRYIDSWRAGEQFLAAQASEYILEELGFDVPQAAKVALIEAFALAGEDADLNLAEGIKECLVGLKAAGLRLGIICDVGFTPSTTLRRHLDGHGLLELFDHWSFSDEVGRYKPSAVIFEHALGGLGVAADQAAHVGDIRRTDVAGAHAMGMVSVRYRGINDDQSQPEPEAHHVVDHHRQVAEVLGVA